MCRVEFVRKTSLLAVLGIASLTVAAEKTEPSRHRTPDASSAESIQHLQQQIAELKAIVVEMRSEVSSSRQALTELTKELQQTRSWLAQQNARRIPERQTPGAGSEIAESATQGTSTERKTISDEELELLNAKINEQYQTKVESASKYRVRLSGLLLFNTFSNSGEVDNIDFPHFALPEGIIPRRETFGGSLRQSQIGLELFGPTLFNARTSADLQLDFAGGFAATDNGVSSGLVRLRTGTLRLDWPRTSLIGGQDALFFSPLSPTSLASLAVPAFAYAGNLWAWTPQIRVQHKFDLGNQRFTFQGGILDSFTGEPPYAAFYRTSTAGENSGQPAYALRAAWASGASDTASGFGVSGYYGRQNWGFDRHVDAWAGMADWNVSLGQLFAVSGEFYGGRGVGGLGGGLGRSVLYSGPFQLASSRIIGLDSMGGWAQLKVKPATKLEFNAAFGQDNVRAAQVRAFGGPQNALNVLYDPALTRNRSAFVNVIYRMRSNLLLSLENRQIETFRVDERSKSANHTSMSVGVLF
jgi:hypothetical protein